MTNNFLIQILRTFTKKEMTRFWEFAYSPYFNKHKKVQELIDYLNKVYPHFEAKKCDRKKLSQHLFPDTKPDQKQLALLFTYALRLLEKFLAVEQLRKAELQNQLYQSQQLRTRGFTLVFEKKMRGLQQRLQDNPHRDSRYFEQQFQVFNEWNQLLPTVLNQANYLLEKQKNLDYFFLSEKLKDACEVTLRNKILKTDTQLELLETALAEVANKLEYYEEIASIVLYENIYKLLNNKELGQYSNVLNLLAQHESQLPKSELQNIYNYLQNYCIEQINQGEATFLQELFSIYQSQLDKDLLIVDGYLPEWHYKNIVTTGLRLQANSWVKNFIEAYRLRLKPTIVENAYSYNLAAYFYNTQQYEGVLQLLVQVEYTDIRYNLDAKSLLLRTYFDLHEEEALLSLTDTFQQFLKRSRQLSEFQKEGYYNLLKFTRRAFQIRSDRGFVGKEKSREDLIKLKAEMMAVKAIFNRGWLEVKVGEMEHSF